MRLEGLLNQVNYTVLQGGLNINIKNIKHDSREVKEGSLFVCVEGAGRDGHDYIKEAIEAGAIAVLVTRFVEISDKNTPIVQIDDARETLALIATKYYNRPTSQFILVGITGSSGTTAIVDMINHVLVARNKKTGVISRSGSYIGKEPIELEHSNLDILEVQYLFKKMVDANVNNVVMEISPHALAKKRIEGAEFDVLVFTGLKEADEEKLDTYIKATTKLLKETKKGVINMDDQNSKKITECLEDEQILTYSLSDDSADLYAHDIKVSTERTEFIMKFGRNDYAFSIEATGKIGVYNILAAVGACVLMGKPLDIILKVINNA